MPIPLIVTCYEKWTAPIGDVWSYGHCRCLEGDNTKRNADCSSFQQRQVACLSNISLYWHLKFGLIWLFLFVLFFVPPSQVTPEYILWNQKNDLHLLLWIIALQKSNESMIHIWKQIKWHLISIHCNDVILVKSSFWEVKSFESC